MSFGALVFHLTWSEADFYTGSEDVFLYQGGLSYISLGLAFLPNPFRRDIWTMSLGGYFPLKYIIIHVLWILS